jgi:hypothetical protein
MNGEVDVFPAVVGLLVGRQCVLAEMCGKSDVCREDGWMDGWMDIKFW